MNPNSTNTASAPSSTRNSMSKTWITAKRRSNHAAQQATNNTVEVFYKSILTNAKKMMSQSASVFERDYRYDKTENAFAMHAFMSSTFYFCLECDVHYNYNVEYAFCRCPYEAELRAMLTDYPFKLRSTEVTLTPDFNTFYQRVLSFQDNQFISKPLFK